MFWKKPVNVNFVTVLLVSILLLVGVVLCGSALIQLQTASQGMADYIESTEAGPVSGWGIIGAGIGWGFTALAQAVVLMALLVILFFFCLLTIPLVIARCIYRKEGSRLLAYRILMGFVYVILAGMTVFTGFFLREYPEEMLVGIPVILGLLAILGINVVNTYSGRIKRD